MLDGDELREILGSTAPTVDNHDRTARIALAKRYALLCNVVASQGLTVVIATISLFSEIHEWNRSNLPNYFEVYLRVPISELRRRDTKGLYRSFDSGEIANVAGLDLAVDEPLYPHLLVDYAPDTSVHVSVQRVLQALELEQK
jgi:adenylylsulfate kinase-like enzyme